MVTSINNEMKWGPLHPHVLMEEVLLLFKIYWLISLNCFGHDNISGVYVDDLYFFNIFGSNFEARFSSLSLTSTTNDCFEQHSSVLCQGIL
jgi:hypothetical protein